MEPQEEESYDADAAADAADASSAPDAAPDPDPDRGRDTRDSDIAVATAVDAKDDPEYLYNAVEYDPDSKPPLSKNKRFRAYTALALVMVGVVTLLFILYTIKATQRANYLDRFKLVAGPPTLAPSLSPTSNRMLSGIREQLEAHVLDARNETFAGLNRTDPRFRALDWILHHDELQLMSDDNNLFQRFVLAVLAYALNSGSWLICGVPWRSNGTVLNSNECRYALQSGGVMWLCRDVKIVMGQDATEDDCIKSSVWLSSTDECSWFGVVCAGGILRGIMLRENRLVGQLPHEIGALSSMQLLQLNANCLYGTIPPELGAILHLLSLELHENGLSGEMPANLYTLENLQLLNLADQYGSTRVCDRTDGKKVAPRFALGGTQQPLVENVGLTGALGPALGNWRSLKGLYLFKNAFMGSLPEEIGGMKHLTFLRLGDNFIQGSLPAAITKLRKLKDLRLNDNFLVSSLPLDIGRMNRLQILHLQGNSMFGELPVGLYELTRLKQLRLERTLMREYPYLAVADEGFNGTLSESIGNLTKLKLLIINDNPLTGTIPTELGLCEELKALHIHHTNFNGTLPAQICMLRDMNLNSEGNQGIIYADCKAQNITEPPFLECNCCSDCCDHSTGVCIADD